jgi:hypothetical protein
MAKWRSIASLLRSFRRKLLGGNCNMATLGGAVTGSEANRRQFAIESASATATEILGAELTRRKAPLCCLANEKPAKSRLHGRSWHRVRGCFYESAWSDEGSVFEVREASAQRHLPIQTITPGRDNVPAPCAITSVSCVRSRDANRVEI